MKIRSSIHLDGKTMALQLFPVLQETDDHLLLKLAAYIFFHGRDLLVITSAQQHAALMGQDFSPDLMTVNLINEVTLWIQCGKTTLRKLDKITKRFRESRIWVLMTSPVEAKQMAEALEGEGNTRIEVWSFKYGEFARWRSLVREQNDVIGEATETSMNLVINNEVFITELERIR